MLLRYLKVDMSKVKVALSQSEEKEVDHFEDKKGGGPDDDDAGAGSALELEGLVVRRMCRKCLEMSNKFYLAYQGFELIPLQVNECLQELREHLENSRRGSGDKGGGGCVTGESGTLKGEVLRKCQRKLVSVPRVTLRDVGDSCSWPKIDPQYEVQVEEEYIIKREVVDHQPYYITQLEDLQDADMSDPDWNSDYEVEARSKKKQALSKKRRINENVGLPKADENLIKDTPINLDKVTYQRDLTKCKFACYICSKMFTSKSTLQIHMGIHRKTPQTQYKCTHCGQQSSSSQELQRHLFCTHPIQLLGKDLPPGTTATQLESVIQQILNQWKIIHTKKFVKKFKCSTCGGLFRFRGSFERRLHLIKFHFNLIVAKVKKLQHNNAEPREDAELLAPAALTSVTNSITCTYCGYMSEKRRYHREHQMHKHPNCCFAEILSPNASESDVKKAIQTAYETTRNAGGKWRCHFCPVTFGKKYHYKRHFLTMHPESVFSGLLKHDSGGGSGAGACKSTTANFLQSKLTMSSLGKQPLVAVPNNANGMPCNDCKKILRNTRSLRYHRLSQHPYLYFYEKLPFITSEMFEETIKTMVEEARLPEPENGKEFQCTICRAYLGTTFNIKVHLLSMIHVNAIYSRLSNQNHQLRQLHASNPNGDQNNFIGNNAESDDDDNEEATETDDENLNQDPIECKLQPQFGAEEEDKDVVGVFKIEGRTIESHHDVHEMDIG